MAQSNPFCISCGSELRPGASFCGKCGTTIEQGSFSPTSPAYKNPRQESFEEYENDYVGRIGGNSNPQPRYNNSQRNGPYVGVSAAWWLLPIFFSFIGGIIAWVCVKDTDPRMAKNCLILGIVITVVPFLIVLLMVVATLPYGFDMR
jgi:hypothetical protein